MNRVFEFKRALLLSIICLVMMIVHSIWTYRLAAAEKKILTYGVRFTRDLYVTLMPLEHWQSYAAGLAYPDQLIAFDNMLVSKDLDYQSLVRLSDPNRAHRHTFRIADGTLRDIDLVAYRTHENDFLLSFVFPWVTGICLFLSGLLLFLYFRTLACALVMIVGLIASMWLGQLHDYFTKHVFQYFTMNLGFTCTLGLVFAPNILLKIRPSVFSKISLGALTLAWLGLFFWYNWSLLYWDRESVTFLNCSWILLAGASLRGSYLAFHSFFIEKDLSPNLAWPIFVLVLGMCVEAHLAPFAVIAHRPVQFNQFIPLCVLIPFSILYAIAVGLKGFNENLQKEIRTVREQLVSRARLNTAQILLAGMSHEIFNPLQVIFTRNNLLKKDLGDLRKIVRRANKEKNIQDLKGLISKISKGQKIVFDCALRIKTVIDDVRNVKRADLHQTLCNAKKEVLRVFASLEEEAKVKTVTVEVMSSLDVPLRCDVSRFHQVIFNVLSNAISASHSGGHIEVGLQQEGAFSVIVVRDQGHGMTQEVLDRALEPFFTTKDPGSGMGLGLYISSQIMRLHGGTLEVNSEPQQFTTVRMAFPYSNS